MNYWIEGTRTLFSRPKYALAFLILLVFLATVYAALTDIIILNPFSFNPVLNLPLATIIIIDAVLAALGFTILVFQISERTGTRNTVTFGAGSLLTAFASACVVCQPIWLFWLGLGTSTAFLANYSIYIGIASAMLLAWSLNNGLASIAKGKCQI